MIVAVTGVILILFVIGHLLGNLQIFLGPDGSTATPSICASWGRFSGSSAAFLLVVVLLHIYYTIRLAIENRRARPGALQTQGHRESDLRLAHAWC